MSELAASAVDIKAGSVTLAAVGQTQPVVFDVPYLDANYAVTLGIGTTGNFDQGVVFELKTATGFTLKSGTSTSLQCNWMTVPFGGA